MTHARRLGAFIADAFWRLFQSAGGDRAAAPTGPGDRGAGRGGLLAPRAPLLPAGQPAGGAGRALAHAVGPGVVVRRRRRRRNRGEVRPQARPGSAPGACPCPRPVSSGQSKGRPEESVEVDALRIRTVFALRFGHVRTDDGELRQPGRRPAPRSTARSGPSCSPARRSGRRGSTSIPGATALIHWNLPGNPVDLEQREGRIHRYKGHAVPRNAAASHADDAFAVVARG